MVVLAIQVSAVLAEFAGAGAPARGYRVLVVDDEPDIRNAVKLILERSLKDVRVLTAPDGYAGLDILKREHIDLILTDFKMPGLNGVEFIREAMKVTPTTPRILITAFERELASEAGFKGAFSHIFTKPLDPKPLVKTLQRMLDETHA